MAATRKVTEAEVATYETDGVVHLKGAFDASWVEMLRERVEHVMASPGKLGHDLSKSGGAIFFRYVSLASK
ncbi:MAG: hypothetical protein JKY20_10975 [Alphaproteobacteria bacterium]|nr:hypothetical protein [Alphaproteobacteria bacterium]